MYEEKMYGKILVKDILFFQKLAAPLSKTKKVCVKFFRNEALD
jgi:hypothetical protein